MIRFPRKYLQMMFPEKSIQLSANKKEVSFNECRKLNLTLEDCLMLISRFLTQDTEIKKRVLLFMIDAIIHSVDLKTFDSIKENLQILIFRIENEDTNPLKIRVCTFSDIDYILSKLNRREIDVLDFDMKQIKNFLHLRMISEKFEENGSDHLEWYQNKIDWIYNRFIYWMKEKHPINILS